ncbi:MAG: hypothetical protein U9O95_06595 [Candidatus Marinimicrobia bacterium]|nr:hypothetical protein [Candidatus Neomarinimicrobiota bacterium]
MKVAILVLTVLLLFSCTGQDLLEKDLGYYELKGKVNHLTILHYYAVEKDGKIVKGESNKEGEIDQTVSFNKKGYITQAYFYGKTDSLDAKLVRNYNDKQLCIGETRYDALGKILMDWIWLYDENSNNTERIQIFEDSSLFSSWFLYYDEDNELIARMAYRSPESVLFDSLYWVLDERGRQIEEKSYGYYGYYGITKIEYNGNSDLPAKIYIYDSMDYLTNILEMQYNDHDLMSTVHQYNADTLLITAVAFDYKYDDKGNWITRIQYFDDEPGNYEERKIIYY